MALEQARLRSLLPEAWTHSMTRCGSSPAYYAFTGQVSGQRVKLDCYHRLPDIAPPKLMAAGWRLTASAGLFKPIGQIGEYYEKPYFK